MMIIIIGEPLYFQKENWTKQRTKMNFELYNATQRSVLLLFIHQILTFIQGLSGVGNFFFYFFFVIEFGSLTISQPLLSAPLVYILTVVIIHTYIHTYIRYVDLCLLCCAVCIFRSRSLSLSLFFFFLFFFHFLSWVSRVVEFCITFETKRNTMIWPGGRKFNDIMHGIAAFLWDLCRNWSFLFFLIWF